MPPMKSTGMNTATSDSVIERIVKPISFDPSKAARIGALPISMCAVPAMTKAWADPFNKTSAVKAVVDGSGPSSAKMKAMVESGKVTWDVVDRNLIAGLELGRQSLLEKIDYSIVDKSKVRPDHAGEWSVGSYIYANVLAYQTDAFGGRTPKTWKDFYNLKDFPGKRTMRKHIDGQLETALLADGVPADKLYPIDVKRALDKIKSIKKDVFFWSTGAESQQLLRDKEVTMGSVWNTRAMVSKRESNGKIDFHFNEGSAWVGAWLVPKGNPAGKDAFKFIASSQDPAGQVVLFEALGNGPVNPAAARWCRRISRRSIPAVRRITRSRYPPIRTGTRPTARRC